MLKSCDVRGVFYGEFVARDPAGNAAMIADLFAMVASSGIKPPISQTFPLARGGEAIAVLGERRAIGKIVVTIGD